MTLKDVITKLRRPSNKLVGIWETKHGDDRESMMRLFDDGTGIIFCWEYKNYEEPREVFYEIEWRMARFSKIGFRLKNEKKFVYINYVIKTYLDSNGNIFDELHDPYFRIGKNKTVKFFWKVCGKLYRHKNVE